MKTKNIKQVVTFKSSPAKVYELIMDEKKHSEFSGSKAKVSKKPKGKFEVFDGYCHGYNIELEEGKLIRQAWHFAEDGWPDDHYSICTFQFAKVPGGTKMTFTQEGVPEHKVESLKEGWKDYYWAPMKEMLEK